MKLPIGGIEPYKTGGGKIRWRLQYDEHHIYGYDTEAEAIAAQAEYFGTGYTQNPFIKDVIIYKDVRIEYTASGYYTMPGYASKYLENVKARIDAGRPLTSGEIVEDYVAPEAPGEPAVEKSLLTVAVLAVVGVILGIIVLMFRRK